MNNLKNLGLHTSLFQKVYVFMRSKLFNAIYQVLQFDNQSIYVTMTLSFIQMFQLIYLAFALKTSYLWNNPYITEIITQFLRQINKSDQVAILQLCCILLIQIIILSLYFLFQNQIQKLWQFQQRQKLERLINQYEFFLIRRKFIPNKEIESPKKKSFCEITYTDFSIFLALLYFFFSIVLLTIMLLFLVGILDKDAPLILIKMLCYLLKFLLTIGYFPLMQIFFGFLACHDKNGVQVMVYLDSQVCWTLEYSIHAIFAVFSLILSQALISVVSLICYQSKKTQTNAFSQRTGRPYSFYHYCILINIMTYQLLETPQYISLILIVFLINSQMNKFIKFNIKIQQNAVVKSTQPFHNKNIQTLWVIITALNFWTSLMLTFAAILEGNYFRKSLYAWLIGIPFLTIIIIREPSESVDLFEANIHPHESGDDIIQLCEYLLDMIQNAHNDQYLQLELDAYIEVQKIYKILIQLNYLYQLYCLNQKKYQLFWILQNFTHQHLQFKITAKINKNSKSERIHFLYPNHLLNNNFQIVNMKMTVKYSQTIIFNKFVKSFLDMKIIFYFQKYNFMKIAFLSYAKKHVCYKLLSTNFLQQFCPQLVDIFQLILYILSLKKKFFNQNFKLR